MLVGSFLVSMDRTVVSTITPLIIQDLGGTALYAWVATSFALAKAVTQPITARLAETGQLRWMYLFFTGIFLVGSVLCGMAETLPTLILARSFQGIGGGGMGSVGSTLIGILFPPRKRGRYFGYFGAVLGVATICGPLVGGLLADTISWRAVFFLNLIPGSVALGFIAFKMPNFSKVGKGGFDIFGAVLLVVWSIPLLLALSWAGSAYPWTSPIILGLLAFAVSALGLFLFVESRNPEPLMNLTLLRDRVVFWCSAANTCGVSALRAALLFVPLYLIQAKGFSAMEAGITLLPATICGIIAALGTGRVVEKVGKCRGPLLLGNFISAALMGVAYAGFDTDTPTWMVAVVLGIVGFGFGTLSPVYPMAVQNAVPRERLATTTSAFQFVSTIGAAFLVGLMGSLMVAELHRSLPKNLPTDLRVALLQSEVDKFVDEKQFYENLTGVTKKFSEELKAVAAGEDGARAKLLKDPIVPHTLRAEIESGELTSSKIEEHTKTFEAHLDKAIQRTLSATFADGLNHVFGVGTILATLAFLFTFAIPDLELGKADPVKPEVVESAESEPEAEVDGQTIDDSETVEESEPEEES